MGRFGPVRRLPLAVVIFEDRCGQPYSNFRLSLADVRWAAAHLGGQLIFALAQVDNMPQPVRCPFDRTLRTASKRPVKRPATSNKAIVAATCTSTLHAVVMPPRRREYETSPQRGDQRPPGWRPPAATARSMAKASMRAPAPSPNSGHEVGCEDRSCFATRRCSRAESEDPSPRRETDPEAQARWVVSGSDSPTTWPETARPASIGRGSSPTSCVHAGADTPSCSGGNLRAANVTLGYTVDGFISRI